MKTNSFLLGALLLFQTFAVAPLLAATRHVDDSNQSGTQNGSTLHPYTSIQSAIASAANGDTIKVAAGQYTPITTLGKSLTILGGYTGALPSAYASGLGGDFSQQGQARSATIINGNGTNVVGVAFTRFDEAPYHATLDNFTVRNCGKGISCDTSVSWPHPVNVTITRNLVESNGVSNVTTVGGGLLVAGTNVVVLNNIIRRNRGGRGAGIMRVGGDTSLLRIEGNVIEGNICQDDHGGGIMVFGDVVLTRNVISSNRIDLSYGWGGGVLMHSVGTMQSSRNVMHHNYAPSYGAAFFVDEGATAVLRNDLIHHNWTATGFGGGVAVDDGEPGASRLYLTNCTVAYNNTQFTDTNVVSGNGVFADNQALGTSTTVENCIFWGNGDDFFAATGAVLTVNRSLSKETWPGGTGNLHLNPLFFNSTTNFTLQSGSPAINAGSNQVWMTSATDLAGKPRIAGGKVDMGAYEWQPIPPAITAQPQSQTALRGANVTFSCSSTGTAPLRFQWRFNGTNLSGATLSSYARTNVQTVHAGSYSVVVTNIAGRVTSSNAVLTVWVKPAITAQPQSRTSVAGSNVTFSVTATGTTPLTYQWRWKGTNISGGTKSSYSIINVQPRHAGYYNVVVSNVADSITSSNATLAVKFMLRGVTVGNGTISPTNILVNPGSSQTFTAAPLAGYTVGEWQANGIRKQTGGANFSLQNIQTNSVVKVIFRPLIKLYWQDTNGWSAEWRMNGTNYLTTVSLPSIGAGWRLCGQRDFNADAHTDFVFQNTSGQLLLRTMNGTAMVRDNLVRNGQAAPAGWKLAALSDFSGDAQIDFLFQTSTNRLAAWYMNKGTNWLSTTLLQAHNSGWKVVGMADFNADNKNDILWQNSLGNVSVWFMNGRTNTGSVNLFSNQTAVAGWNISALADLDFNGQKDILGQNSKGQVAVWLMQRTNHLRTTLLRNGQTNASNWQLRGPK